jgi:TP901-1 family phage major tail protein
MSERAGKDLLLKFGQSMTIDVAVGTADSPTHILETAHGLSVGDVVVFDTVPGSVSEVTANTPYYVKAVPSSGAFTISLAPAGTVITFTDTITALAITVFKTIGGLRTHSMNFGSEAIDGTNYGSSQWKKIIDGAGIRSMSVSGDGVFNDDANFEALQDAALANTNVDLVFVDVSSGVIFLGEFKVTSFELGAAHDAEGTYSMSAESSGAVTATRAA